ncbi:MAG: 5-(carboxyamino)imidazole ribonucleotide mutase [Sphaerochaeta sp.]|jgi:5-(carboxyamino)imidazole ribonucleotide mutase|nr:5-(carboxyamino)imidazole ribonucleotide mutase [Sphaerochaeta sp.]
MKTIAIVMGSASDLSVARKAADVLDSLGIPFTVQVYSAHRTPDEAIMFARTAVEKGVGVIIACAGMAAHLAGVIAANTILPVIGVPISASLGGIDALLSTVQMPSGIPVATVAVDGAKNAAYLAAEILALGEPDLTAKLTTERSRMKAAVLQENATVEQGFRS